MTIFDSIILGIVEGVSEFLPISSTGHLILASYFLGLEQTAFLKMFEVAIQLGAILSVVFLYGRRILCNMEGIKKLFVALLPAVIVGGLWYSSIKKLFESELTVAWALLVGGILIILFEFWHKEAEDAEEDFSHMSYKTALFIGIFQTFAVIPGVSRAGATILGGLFLGMKRTAIVEFSFLLAVPTMLVASALDIAETGSMVTTREWGLLFVGGITSFFVATLSIQWLLQFIKTNTFTQFGIYRIVVGLVLLTYLL